MYLQKFLEFSFVNITILPTVHTETVRTPKFPLSNVTVALISSPDTITMFLA
jgi:hypothetical protein